MAPVSLGFRTDLMLLALQGSQVHERTDGLTLVRSPQNPAFWWGNFVLAPSVDAVPAAVALFHAELPEAEHVAIGVDGTDGAPGADAAAAAAGLRPERITILSATAVRPPPHPDPVAELRPLRTDADFAQSLALQEANNPGEDTSFVAQRVADWRALQEHGHGAWFGAFLDGRLRAGLGLFTDGTGVARFQAVDTHPDFRGRGLASTLVHHAARQGLAWPGVHTLVITADPEYHAIRIYRAVGFDGTEAQVQLVRRPPGRD